MENKKIKAIIFDLDDTLIDSKEAERRAINIYTSRYNIFNNNRNLDYYKIWHDLIQELYNEYLEGKISFQSQRNMRMVRLYEMVGVNITIEEAEEKFMEYFQIYKDNWLLVKDALIVLNKLQKNYLLGLITNGDSTLQRDKINKVNIASFFKDITISSEVKVTKPSKEIFLLACQRLGVLPSECIMIGDNYKTDILGAQNASMETIYVNNNCESVECKNKVKKLSDVLGLIEKEY